MKPTSYRRIRRRTSSPEAGNAKRESKQDHFFGGQTSLASFFQPAPSIQRKCDNCEEKDQKAHRAPDKKEEEKKVMRTEDSKKEEDKVQRAPDKKEEDKKAMRVAEDDKPHAEPDHGEDEKRLQKKEAGTSVAPSKNTSNYIGSLNGKGNALPRQTNQFFSARMGYDFSQVRIHTDKSAAESAKDINAKAYAVGHHIVFNEGQYDTQSGAGKKLLAHELAHVVQQSDESKVKRVEDTETPALSTATQQVSSQGQGTNTEDKEAFGCANVDVQGRTNANYDHGTFTSSGSARASTGCEGCEGQECIDASGTITSVFTAHPVVTLPNVPGGLTQCETNAVQTFINTTLRQHEQQHVAAFRTYNGRVRTPYMFKGCRADLDAFIQNLHNGVDTQRINAANALSDALDPFNATIPCNCP